MGGHRRRESRERCHGMDGKGKESTVENSSRKKKSSRLDLLKAFVDPPPKFKNLTSLGLWAANPASAALRD